MSVIRAEIKMKRRRDGEPERQRDGEMESHSVSPSLRLSVLLSLRLSVFVALWLCGYCIISAQEPIRLAVLDLAGDGQGKFAGLLRSLARSPGSEQVELLDEHLTRLAMRGAGYDESINLSREESRALGQSLGCEFYILGKILVTRRAVSTDKFYFEAMAGLFVVEARTGVLTLFVFNREQAGGKGRRVSCSKRR